MAIYENNSFFAFIKFKICDKLTIFKTNEKNNKKKMFAHYTIIKLTEIPFIKTN